MTFQLSSDFAPSGDQPQAIEKLVAGARAGKHAQVLLGITGSGKTFTMAHVIEKLSKPTLVLAHNKTLAAQLYQEFKHFFPNNAVEYFVSYYDYYQPEAYLPRTDTYIEKDLAINDRIEKMRLSATRSLIERSDVIIVASVSCIYGLGAPEHYREMSLRFSTGLRLQREELLLRLVAMHYDRADKDLGRGTFRVRGDLIEIAPAYEDDIAYRIDLIDDIVERIRLIDSLTGKVLEPLNEFTLFPGSHYVIPDNIRYDALSTIQQELQERIAWFEAQNRPIEAQRLRDRTRHDLELIREVGFCKGIENYSRHFSKRGEGEAPPCLVDYFPDDFLLLIDESHQTLPQMHAMYNGDRARKETLIEFGFRLPSAFDNRPLKFEEAYRKFRQVLYISATPGPWEIEEARGRIVEQIIRPTGLLDPILEVRPANGQVDDCLEEIRKETEQGGRVLVTTLTKKLSEELSKYLNEIGVKAKYLHSDVDTLERMHIIKALRIGAFDVLVGINLLREGLDLPEVSLVVILDADKEGFLRSETALIQTCGRAARNERGRAILYADTQTKSIKQTLEITRTRRKIQEEYNTAHNITPRTTRRGKIETLEETFGLTESNSPEEAFAELDIEQKIKESERAMRRAAKELRFDEAARWRDQMRHYQKLQML
jgi:excinuclease ABC subunit B